MVRPLLTVRRSLLSPAVLALGAWAGAGALLGLSWAWAAGLGVGFGVAAFWTRLRAEAGEPRGPGGASPGPPGGRAYDDFADAPTPEQRWLM